MKTRDRFSDKKEKKQNTCDECMIADRFFENLEETIITPEEVDLIRGDNCTEKNSS